MNELNGLQRQILDEIKEDIKKNSDMSIKDFAKRHYISPAFLVNLSKKTWVFRLQGIDIFL